ncbi:hypothetical protein BCR42DRAFT_397376 [Absidia repens]|uniref:F-box domain-containing protein n=1 Tax=Absidia repens TaxID=90262 RepID=A0A1X2I117_9FUNG|nr:hypothetical protein BCR42DRAFT_397376 [Absidia repens]
MVVLLTEKLLYGIKRELMNGGLPLAATSKHMKLERCPIQIKPADNVMPRPLPNEIVALIVHHVDYPECEPRLNDDRQMAEQRELYTFTLVNKQFHAIANPLLWQEPVVGLDSTFLQRLLDCLTATTNQQPLGHHIKKLHLHNTTCTDHQLLLLMTHIPHLETLLIENKRYPENNDVSSALTPLPSPPLISNVSLQFLPRYCSQLTVLEIHSIHLLEPTARAIGQHCHHLRQLTLHLNAVPWQPLFSALTHCPLTLLSITSYERATVTLTETMAMDMLTSFPDLTSFKMNSFDPSGLLMTLAHTVLTTFPTPWPHLKKLDLIRYATLGHAVLTDRSLDAMAMSLPNLHELHLLRVKGISADGVRQLIRHCLGLKVVCLAKCDSIVLGDLLPGVGRLPPSYCIVVLLAVLTLHHHQWFLVWISSLL